MLKSIIPRRRLLQKCHNYIAHPSYSTITTTTKHPEAVPILPNGDLSTFRDAYKANLPVLLPRGFYKSLPAVSKWFTPASQHAHNATSPPTPTAAAALDTTYLSRFGDAVVPLELTDAEGRFAQIQQSLQFFLE